MHIFKKLDKLVVKAFLGPFIATFFLTLLVLVMQFFWLWIDDFVGKGLSIDVIFEFIFYQSAALVPLALPLAVLLSSLMTFGNLGESYELVAIKSAGISLLRFMQPLLIVSVVIAVLAFLFANYTIPVANLKSRTLLTDIVYTKPSFDIKEGVFYDKIPGFAIKIGKREKNDSVIKDIIIYEQTNTGIQDNFIVASDGVMRVSDNKRYLEFHLKNGWRYEERAGDASQASEFIRLGFKEYKKSFDLSSFGFQQRTADSLNKGNAQMLSMRQLSVAIDSIEKTNKDFAKKVRFEVLSSIQAVNLLDSNWTFSAPKLKMKSFDAVVPDSIEGFVRTQVSSKLTNMRASNDAVLLQYKDQLRKLHVHQIEWHRKITFSFACVLLFLIGAPLGSIIRKGGLGSPLVFAIIFFMLFFFTNSSGEKFAKEGEWSATMGMWFSTAILLPVAIFLIYKALHDSQLFNKEFYYRLLSRLPFRKRKQLS